MAMCMNAPFGAAAILVIVHLDRREVGGEPESYARFGRCRVASIFLVERDPGMRLGWPKALVRNALTCAASARLSGPVQRST